MPSPRVTCDTDKLAEWNNIAKLISESSLATKPVRHVLQDNGLPECYQQNAEYLEKADPHAIYPTSIYRSCEGYVLAKPDASVIESTMSTTLTTTIKIVNDVLNPANKELKNVYHAFGR